MQIYSHTHYACPCPKRVIEKGEQNDESLEKQKLNERQKRERKHDRKTLKPTERERREYNELSTLD